jgi:hypothetical protein
MSMLESLTKEPFDESNISRVPGWHYRMVFDEFAGLDKLFDKSSVIFEPEIRQDVILDFYQRRHGFRQVRTVLWSGQSGKD